MKTLYESILDDEDVLIGNSIKDSKNPFKLLYNLFAEENNWNNASAKYRQRAVKIIKNELGDILPKRVLKDLKINYFENGLGISTSGSSIDLITIEKNLYSNSPFVRTNPNDEICVYFPSIFREYSEIEYIFDFAPGKEDNNIKEYWDWMLSICEKFKLNPSKNNTFFFSLSL